MKFCDFCQVVLTFYLQSCNHLSEKVGIYRSHQLYTFHLPLQYGFFGHAAVFKAPRGDSNSNRMRRKCEKWRELAENALKMGLEVA